MDAARIVRDGRVIVHRRPEVGAVSPGPLRESSVRFTRPCGSPWPARVPRSASTPSPNIWGAEFPTASRGKVDALLHGLVDAGVLITSLRPPMTGVDPLSHLIDVWVDAASVLMDVLWFRVSRDPVEPVAPRIRPARPGQPPLLPASSKDASASATSRDWTGRVCCGSGWLTSRVRTVRCPVSSTSARYWACG